MRTQKGITITTAVSFLSLLAFMAIAYIVKQGSLLPYDLAVTQRLHAPEQFVVTQLISSISDLGGSVLVFLILMIAAILAFRRQWTSLILWVGTTGSGYILNVLLKQILQGPRPHLEDMTILEQSTGFPSGHAMMALITYGLLAYGVAPLLGQRRQQRMLIGGLMLLIVLIGYSRMYLGAHYFSDVLGGYATGLFWLTFCLTLDAFAHTIRTTQYQSAAPVGDVSK